MVSPFDSPCPFPLAKTMARYLAISCHRLSLSIGRQELSLHREEVLGGRRYYEGVYREGRRDPILAAFPFLAFWPEVGYAAGRKGSG